MVPYAIRIEPYPFDFGSRAPVVRGIDSVVEQKLRPALGAVDLDRQHSSGSNEDSVLACFGDDETPLLDAKAAAKFRRKNYSAAPANLARRVVHLCQNSMMLECQTIGAQLVPTTGTRRPTRRDWQFGPNAINSFK